MFPVLLGSGRMYRDTSEYLHAKFQRSLQPRAICPYAERIAEATSVGAERIRQRLKGSPQLTPRSHAKMCARLTSAKSGSTWDDLAPTAVTPLWQPSRFGAPLCA